MTRRLGRRSLVAGAIIGSAALASATVALASNDPLFSQQWGLSGQTASINAPQAWCATTGAGILIADVDTGVDFQHRDLAGRLVPGARFTGGRGTMVSSGDPSTLDDSVGHGTATTGLMVANKDDGTGIAGVAPAARALVVRVFDENGNGYTTDAAAAIKWVADDGRAKVLNISLGGDPTGGLGVHASLIPDKGIVDAIHYAAGKGVAVAVSAGNNDTQMPLSQYQQVTADALVVGAVGPAGEGAYYTAPGNVYAPGGDDRSSNGTGGTATNVVTPYKGGGWVAWQGTSFAAPHVAGTLALLMSRGMSAAAARAQVLGSAVNRGGLPELDAAAALGTSGGCNSAPAAANDGGTANPSAPGGSHSAPASRAPSGSRPPAPGTPSGAVALATGTPTTAPSAAASAGATSTPASAGDGMPSPKALAHPPSQQPSKGTPGAVIAAGLAVGAGAAYGAVRLLQSLR